MKIFYIYLFIFIYLFHMALVHHRFMMLPEPRSLHNSLTHPLHGQVLQIVKTMHAFNWCSIECNELAFSLLIFKNSNKSLMLLMCNFSAPLFPTTIIYCTSCSLLLKPIHISCANEHMTSKSPDAKTPL